jgi:uncharacterized protein YcgI (DUF1989 family)
MTETLIEIPARRGKAAFVAAGQAVTVINTHGEQVVDTWAFNRADLGEFMSNEHTRAHSLHLVPRPGDVLRTNKRRPILTLTEDTSGGIHDTLIAACDRYRYALSRAITTIARIICLPEWLSSVLSLRKCRARSIYS